MRFAVKRCTALHSKESLILTALFCEAEGRVINTYTSDSTY